jgi:transcriptional regulator of acetoin/glycerol metabolism
VIELSDLPLGRHAGDIHGGLIGGADGLRVELPDGGITIETMERKLIEATLERSGWNVVKAARLLGVGRGALRYKMRKYQMEPDLEESLT